MRRRRSMRSVAAASAVVFALAALGLRSVSAQEPPGPEPLAEAPAVPTGFAAVALAAGLRAEYVIPGWIAVEEVVGIGAPVSESSLDASGLVSSYAALPYPGEVVLSAPGLAAVVGVPIGALGFPLYVRADHPAQPDDATGDPTGTIEIEAHAAPGDAHATATLTAGVEPVRALTSVADTSTRQEEDGSIVATASVTVEGLSIGGLVEVGRVVTRSTTTLRPGDGEATTEHDTTVEGLNVAGVALTIGPDGLGLAGQQLPGGAAILAGVQTALAVGGVRLDFEGGEEIEGGRTGDVLVIETTQALPVPGEPEGTLRLRFGEVTTFVQAAAPLPSGPAPGVDEAAVPVDQGLPPATSGQVPEPAADLAVPPISVPVDQGSGADLADETILVASDFRDLLEVVVWVLMGLSAVVALAPAAWRAQRGNPTWTS